jgi:KTSC domain
MPVLSKQNGLAVFDSKTTFPRQVFVNVRIVDSSNVESIAWPVTGEPLMIVRYKHGGVYGYLGVSRQRCVAAAYSPSVGQYIASKIKGKFKPVKLSA